MNLASHQRKLLGLLRSREDSSEERDAYFRRVAQSKDLGEARRNIFLWRIFVLERTCALTFSLLKHCGLLAGELQAFIERQNISPFRETQAPAFLKTLSQHEDRLVASVAKFELALLSVRSGEQGPFVIEWTTDPHPVLYNLARDLPAENILSDNRYQTIVSSELPGSFRIIESTVEASSGRNGTPHVNQSQSTEKAFVL